MKWPQQSNSPGANSDLEKMNTWGGEDKDKKDKEKEKEQECLRASLSFSFTDLLTSPSCHCLCHQPLVRYETHTQHTCHLAHALVCSFEATDSI